MIHSYELFDLREHNTFGLNAHCARFITFDDPHKDLPELAKKGVLRNAFILGGGSNLLLVNQMLCCNVIHPTVGNGFHKETHADGKVLYTIPSGTPLITVCTICAHEGLWGTENLSGIPGTVGGAVVQNAGAYGVEMRDVVESVEVFDSMSREFKVYHNSDCAFGYRDSIFKHLDPEWPQIITGVTLRLTNLPSPRLEYKGLSEALKAQGDDLNNITPLQISRAVNQIRESKLPDPLKVGSAGSFFKNPIVDEAQYREVCRKWSESGHDIPVSAHRLDDNRYKLSAAWLIDKAGCKEFAVGGAALWPSTPLVIINKDHATAQDILLLEQQIIRQVKDVFDVCLTAEVIHL